MGDTPASRRQTAYAWAKYYESVRNRHEADRRHYNVANEAAANPSIPEHILAEFKEMATELKKTWECPIHLDMIETNELEVTSCGHYYCKSKMCLQGMKDAARTQGKTHADCAICRRKIPA